MRTLGREVSKRCMTRKNVPVEYDRTEYDLDEDALDEDDESSVSSVSDSD